MNEKMEKLFDLMKDEKSAAELTSKKDAENARRWLSGHGLELSADEFREIGEKIKEMAASVKEDGELTDEQLQKIAGGHVDGQHIGKGEKNIVTFIISVYNWFSGFFD